MQCPEYEGLTFSYTDCPQNTILISGSNLGIMKLRQETPDWCPENHIV